jgi:endoglucanase
VPTRQLIRSTLAVAVVVLWPSAALAAAPQPHVVGNRLVDSATGQTFVPRGVSWPSFEYACQEGYGYSNTAGTGVVGPDAAGAATIARWHVNTVRLPLNEDCWLGDDAQPSFGTATGYREAVQQWVVNLHNAGLAVILDLHWSGPLGVVADGQRAMPDDRSDDFWGSVATTFKGDPSVMFDAFNEPFSQFAANGTPIFELTWTCWRDGGCNAPRPNQDQPPNGQTYVATGMAALVGAIRAAGATQPILLAGRDYANDMGLWAQYKPADDQLVASWHNYNGQACAAQSCWDSTIAPLAATVPVVETELGEDDCKDAHVNDAMTWSDQHGIGYLMWGWYVLDDKACAQVALINDTDGTPRAPNGTAFKAHMDALARGQGGSAVSGPGGASTGSGPAAGGPKANDHTAPSLALAGRRSQRLGRTVSVGVRCGEACRVRVAGSLLARGKRYRLAAKTATLAAGRTKTLALKLTGSARRAARAALRRHGSAVAALTVTVTDASGNARKATRRIKLTQR